MTNNYDLQEYMTRGVEHLAADALKASFQNPRETAFMLKFAAASRKASKKRLQEEKNGLHVPSFLITSITSKCNLHCAGCYSRCNEATTDKEPVRQLSAEEWLSIFQEADSLGISYILLAGGEPMLRRDIIEAAGTMQNIIFPVFTNGTYMNEAYLNLFDKCRNLIPVMSIEGNQKITDERRGTGVYEKVISNMNALYERGILFGASVTVTTENIHEVVSSAFLDSLKGCKLVIYVEFVPTAEEAAHLAPDDHERQFLSDSIKSLREAYPDIIFLSFPGDEKNMGGCIAAGRGFFHINSHGGAEPCPFSPYSDVNVRDTSLKEALRSKLFQSLQDGGYLTEPHTGGCVLYEKREQVEKLLTS